MRDQNKEYTIDAFKKICDDTLQYLPKDVKDKSVLLEARHELALEQLLSSIQKYTNTTNIKLGLQDMSKTLYLEAQIIHVLEHEWSLHDFDKRTVIHDFVTEALSDRRN